MNVINFPVCHFTHGRHFYGGRAFESQQAAIDAMSDKDWRRVVQWEDRHAARFDRKDGRSRHDPRLPACPVHRRCGAVVGVRLMTKLFLKNNLATMKKR